MREVIIFNVFFRRLKLLIIIKQMHRIVTVSYNNKDLCVLNFRDFLNDSIIFFKFF